MPEHLVSRLTMTIRIDLIQSMRQHTHRIITICQSLTVGMDIDTVGQAADDKHLRTSLSQVCDEAVDEVLSVLRTLPCAHNADNLGQIQVGITFII